MWWVLASLVGHTVGSVFNFSVVFLLFLPLLFFDQSWVYSPVVHIQTSLGIIVPPLFVSTIQWRLLRNHVTDAFRWVEYTLVGAVCGVAAKYGLTILPVISGVDTQDFGLGTDLLSGILQIRLITVLASEVIQYLPIAISQGLLWRSQGLPIVWWCLALSGALVLASLPLWFVTGLYSLALEPWSGAIPIFLGFFAAALRVVMTGTLLGLTSAWFIVPLLRRGRDRVMLSEI